MVNKTRSLLLEHNDYKDVSKDDKDMFLFIANSISNLKTQKLTRIRNHVKAT